MPPSWAVGKERENLAQCSLGIFIDFVLSGRYCHPRGQRRSELLLGGGVSFPERAMYLTSNSGSLRCVCQTNLPLRVACVGPHQSRALLAVVLSA
jgi:hypothetical protein